jgi:hypothetical protein
MPHWYGILHTASPQMLESCKGDPVLVRETIMENAPKGANVQRLTWLRGKDEAGIWAEGPAARDYLEMLEARDIVEFVSAHEWQAERT